MNNASTALSHWTVIWKKLQGIGAYLIAIAILISGFWGGHWLTSWSKPDESEQVVSHSEPNTEISLSLEKQAVAEVKVESVVIRTIQPALLVNGNLDYDQTHYAHLTLSTDAIVRQLLIKEGDEVAPGTPLIRLSSSEVAATRSTLLKLKNELEIRQIAQEREQLLHDNLLNLVESIKQTNELDALKTKFEGLTTGKLGNDLMTAISELKLCLSAKQRSDGLLDKGIISTGSAEERSQKLAVAESNLKRVLDDTQFQTRVNLAEAQHAFQEVQKQIMAAQELLDNLQGPMVEHDPRELGGEFVIRAPFRGRVEQLTAANGESLKNGDPLMVLADPDFLWVRAQIPQDQWRKLAEHPRTEHWTFWLSSNQSKKYSAKMLFASGKVSETTRMVDLVGLLEQKDLTLKAGQFVRVSIPSSDPLETIAVPEGALSDDGSGPIVFVRTSEDRFRPVPVHLGYRSDGWVEVKQGLQIGDQVVTHGTFALKSEFLLEAEE